MVLGLVEFVSLGADVVANALEKGVALSTGPGLQFFAGLVVIVYGAATADRRLL